MRKMKTTMSIQRIRVTIQIVFVVICIWMGIQFHFFVRFLESNGTTMFAARPPGVEGFLPISSLMSLYYTALSGELHPAHPAGLVLLITFLLISIVFGKSFCGWICPIGFMSESVGEFGHRVFKHKFKIIKWLDYALRSLKYLLLGFFLWAILSMSAGDLKLFLDMPYNLMADIKMYQFFADISWTAVMVIAALLLLSIIFQGFWCRYLCPYGALLGILGVLSPQKIRRNPHTCINCGKCARVCPAYLPVDQVKTVVSDECLTCLNCVGVCPVPDTLHLTNILTRRMWKPISVAITIVAIFVLLTGAARLAGYWHNQIPLETYLELYPSVKNLGHPTGVEELHQ